jgi:hypothetical protein
MMSVGRTGTRSICLPIASRIAATMAGVLEMVGGSPTPFAPSGAIGSGSSISVTITSGMSRNVGSR